MAASGVLANTASAAHSGRGEYLVIEHTYALRHAHELVGLQRITELVTGAKVRAASALAASGRTAAELHVYARLLRLYYRKLLR